MGTIRAFLLTLAVRGAGHPRRACGRAGRAAGATTDCFFAVAQAVATVDADCGSVVWWYLPLSIISLLVLKMYHLLPLKARVKTWAVITFRTCAAAPLAAGDPPSAAT